MILFLEFPIFFQLFAIFVCKISEIKLLGQCGCCISKYSVRCVYFDNTVLKIHVFHFFLSIKIVMHFLLLFSVCFKNLTEMKIKKCLVSMFLVIFLICGCCKKFSWLIRLFFKYHGCNLFLLLIFDLFLPFR